MSATHQSAWAPTNTTHEGMQRNILSSAVVDQIHFSNTSSLQNPSDRHLPSHPPDMFPISYQPFPLQPSRRQADTQTDSQRDRNQSIGSARRGIHSILSFSNFPLKSLPPVISHANPRPPLTQNIYYAAPPHKGKTCHQQRFPAIPPAAVTQCDRPSNRQKPNPGFCPKGNTRGSGGRDRRYRAAHPQDRHRRLVRAPRGPTTKHNLGERICIARIIRMLSNIEHVPFYFTPKLKNCGRRGG